MNHSKHHSTKDTSAALRSKPLPIKPKKDTKPVTNKLNPRPNQLNRSTSVNKENKVAKPTANKSKEMNKGKKSQMTRSRSASKIAHEDKAISLEEFYKKMIENNATMENFKTLILSKNFSINEKTYEIMSKTEEASQLLSKEQFWIVYIDYLLKSNLLLSQDAFVTISNFAFIHLEQSNQLLKKFYLDNIKKFSALPTEMDYLNLLESSVKSFVLSQSQKKMYVKLSPKEEQQSIEIPIEKADEAPKEVDNINFSFSQNKEGNVSEVTSAFKPNIIHYKLKSISKINTKHPNLANDETRDKVDDTVFLSSMKDKSNRSAVSPFKSTNSKRKYSDEPYPEDIVEGSIQKFNQSFKQENEVKTPNVAQIINQ